MIEPEVIGLEVTEFDPAVTAMLVLGQPGLYFAVTTIFATIVS